MAEGREAIVGMAKNIGLSSDTAGVKSSPKTPLMELRLQSGCAWGR